MRRLRETCRATLVAVTFAGAALAQTGSGAAAQGLFEEARALMAAGRAAEACPKLEESQRLDAASGTLLNLAKCYQETGRTASAWSTYLEAAAAAAATGNLARERNARAQAAALAPRVSRLIIAVAEGANVPGLEITRQGIPVGEPQWNTALPADPGMHEVVARAPGYEPWRTTLTLEGEGRTTTITVPAFVKAEEPVVEAPAPEPVPVVSASAPASRPESAAFAGQRVAALAAFGVGAVGFGVGAVFGLKALSKQSDAEEYCDGPACADARGVTAGDAARSAASVATIGFIVGAAGVASGVTLWLTAPEQRVRTALGLSPAGVQLRGTW